MLKKKGFSQVVSTVVLIALTVAAIATVLVIVRSYVSGGLNSASACNDILDKVKINPDYTCFDPTTSSTLVSISRNQFAMDSLLVSISYTDSGKTFFLKNTAENISGVKYYSETGSPQGAVALPKNESGVTYCFNETNSAPDSIQIAPKRGGTQCSVVDTFNNVPTCATSIHC